MRSLSKLLALLLLASGVAGGAATAKSAANVGFEELSVPYGSEPPIKIGVWYPTTSAASPQPLGGWSQTIAPAAPIAPGRHPLVVMSHGNGGWFAGHYDTALALAHAGFVVAALTHPGDNYQDQSRATDMAARPRALHRLIDYLLAEWPSHGSIDPARIGAFGFSSGGFTVLVAIGGVPDFGKFPAHCQAHPDYFDCKLSGNVPADIATHFPPSVWLHDDRIKAAVVAAPALGFTFAPDGLKTVAIPVQLWRAEADRILPHPDYAEAVRGALPTPPDYHVVPNADHFDFLAP
jgi:predicted dienelactone hydrolase